MNRFDWSDPFLLDEQLSDDERMVRDTARSYAQDRLAPRVIARTLRAIAGAGLAKAVLDVDTASPTGANTLYEGLGFVPTERDRVLVARM